MKKKCLFILFLAVIIAGVPVLAQEHDGRAVDFHLNFMNFGVGAYMPFEGKHVIEFSADLLTFGIEHRGTSLGITFCPFNFFGWIGKGDEIGGTSITNPFSGIFSLVNLNIYWNILGFFDVDNRFYIGPFVGLNSVFMWQQFYMDRYILSAGMQGGIRGIGEKINYNIFSIETGFRLIEGDAKFFVGIKFDIFMNMVKKKGWL